MPARGPTAVQARAATDAALAAPNADLTRALAAVVTASAGALTLAALTAPSTGAEFGAFQARGETMTAPNLILRRAFVSEVGCDPEVATKVRDPQTGKLKFVNPNAVSTGALKGA